MVSEYQSALERGKRVDVNVSNEAVHLARFMVWAYDEVNENLQDDALKSAIKAILHYMSRKYQLNEADYRSVLLSESS